MRWSLCSPSSCAWAHGGKSPSGCRDAWGVRQRVEHPGVCPSIPGSVPPSSVSPCLGSVSQSLGLPLCLSLHHRVCPCVWGSVPLSRGLFPHPGLCSSIPSSVPGSVPPPWGLSLCPGVVLAGGTPQTSAASNPGTHHPFPLPGRDPLFAGRDVGCGARERPQGFRGAGRT